MGHEQFASQRAGEEPPAGRSEASSMCFPNSVWQARQNYLFPKVIKITLLVNSANEMSCENMTDL
jgi:hypothetical protein